jgi:hypothetical protein
MLMRKMLTALKYVDEKNVGNTYEKCLRKMLVTLPKNVDEKMFATLLKNIDEKMLVTLLNNV